MALAGAQWTTPNVQHDRKFVRIADDQTRQEMFTRRKNQLMRKAMELSVLCDCEIALVVFGEGGHMGVKQHQYSSGDMDTLLERYRSGKHQPHERRTNADLYDAQFERECKDDSDTDDYSEDDDVRFPRPGSTGGVAGTAHELTNGKAAKNKVSLKATAKQNGVGPVANGITTLTPRIEKALSRINHEFDALAAMTGNMVGITSGQANEPSPTSLYIMPGSGLTPPSTGLTPPSSDGLFGALGNGRSPDAPDGGIGEFIEMLSGGVEPKELKTQKVQLQAPPKVANVKVAQANGTKQKAIKDIASNSNTNKSSGTPRKRDDLSILIPENLSKNIVVNGDSSGVPDGDEQRESGKDGDSGRGEVAAGLGHEGETPDTLRRHMEGAFPSPLGLGNLSSPGGNLAGVLPTPGFLSNIEWPSPKSLNGSLRVTGQAQAGPSAAAFDNLVVTGTAMTIVANGTKLEDKAMASPSKSGTKRKQGDLAAADNKKKK